MKNHMLVEGSTVYKYVVGEGWYWWFATTNKKHGPFCDINSCFVDHDEQCKK